MSNTRMHMIEECESVQGKCVLMLLMQCGNASVEYMSDKLGLSRLELLPVLRSLESDGMVRRLDESSERVVLA